MAEWELGISFERRKAWGALFRAMDVAEEIADPEAKVRALVKIAEVWAEVELDRAIERTLQPGDPEQENLTRGRRDSGSGSSDEETE
jgi:hypothetical protein